MTLDSLATSRAHGAKDLSKAGWKARKQATSKTIERAMEYINRARTEQRTFLREASQNYTLQQLGRNRLGQLHATKFLDEAYTSLREAAVIVERAEPMVNDVPTAAEARRVLSRDIKHALEASSLSTKISNGRELPDDASESDLTPFEQLLSALAVHESETPSAMSRWIRDALSGE